ncbi:hypothetical protein [Nannocystis pusilla]|uniref:hypothetical protein n=1 Tax=Nannocystis pusilla TaxID=889268 RepID=UPI003DA4C1A7
MSQLPAFVAACLVFLLASEAGAELEPKRKGLQVDIAGGLSFCMPGGAARCKRVDGVTAPHAGGVVTVGYRFRPWLLAGLSYEFGLLRPSYTDILGGRPLYGPARHQGIFGVVRTGVDVGRVDLGLEARPRLLAAGRHLRPRRLPRSALRHARVRGPGHPAGRRLPHASGLPRPALGRDDELPPQPGV